MKQCNGHNVQPRGIPQGNWTAQTNLIIHLYA